MAHRGVEVVGAIASKYVARDLRRSRRLRRRVAMGCRLVVAPTTLSLKSVMPTPTRKRELGRGERVLPGVWRLRLPLPWPGVPALQRLGAGRRRRDRAGRHRACTSPGSLGHLERALDQVNLRLEHVRLLVCTHAHSDHYGQAGDDRRARRAASCGCTPTTST